MSDGSTNQNDTRDFAHLFSGRTGQSCPNRDSVPIMAESLGELRRAADMGFPLTTTRYAKSVTRSIAVTHLKEYKLAIKKEI